MGIIVKLGNVRMSLEQIYVAKAYKPGDAEKFRAKFLVEPGSDNDKKICDAIAAIAAEKWGKSADKMLQKFDGDARALCYLDGDEGDFEPAKGHMVLTGSKKKENDKTRVLLQNENKEVIEYDDGTLKAGDYVHASVELYPTADGIFCNLRTIRKFRTGASLGGKKAVSASELDEFDDLSVEADESLEDLA